MTHIDYAPDKFGESVRAIGDLICATIPNLSSSSKLDVISQCLLSILKRPVQQRLLDRLGFYKSLNDLYTDLECQHCNFSGHNKAQCKEFAKGLLKADYTVERKDIPVALKATYAVSTPCTNILRPAVVVLPINGLSTKCLIDSGSVISLIHFNNARFFDSYECEFKITGVRGLKKPSNHIPS
uniref:Peptidase A2 domain-containing protein n=1 Tax=Strongyloides venezuelensis TaxID=75913 RepID=A0A0K0FQH4_STRVS